MELVAYSDSVILRLSEYGVDFVLIALLRC